MRMRHRALSLLILLLALALPACGPDLAQLNAPNGLDINAIALTSADSGWAVGLRPGQSQPILLHETQGAWQADTNPPPVSAGDAFTALAVTRDTLWIGGSRSDAAHGDATQTSGFVEARGSDGVWRTQRFGAGINALAFLSATEGWAAGRNGGIYHFVDGVWTQAANAMSDDLYGLAFRAANDGWAVGDMGTFMHWDGATWTHQEHFTHSPVHGVALAASDGWAVGDDGTTFRLGDHGWFTYATPMAVTNHAVVIAQGIVWAVGDHGSIFARDLSGNWNHLPTPGDIQFNAIAVAPDGSVWVGANADHSQLYHYVANTWQAVAVSLAPGGKA